MVMHVLYYLKTKTLMVYIILLIIFSFVVNLKIHRVQASLTYSNHHHTNLYEFAYILHLIHLFFLLLFLIYIYLLFHYPKIQPILHDDQLSLLLLILVYHLLIFQVTLHSNILMIINHHLLVL